MSKRRAHILLTEEMIARFFKFPEGVSVAGIRDNFLCNGVDILVEGEMFDEVAEGTMPPRVQANLSVNSTGEIEFEMEWYGCV